MPDRRSLPALSAPLGGLRPVLVMAAPFCLALAFFALITGSTPGAALLPVLSAACIAAAAPTALFAFTMREPQSGAFSLMDAAGVLTFVGCAAAMLSNPESIRQTFAVSLTQ